MADGDGVAMLGDLSDVDGVATATCCAATDDDWHVRVAVVASACRTAGGTGTLEPGNLGLSFEVDFVIGLG